MRALLLVLWLAIGVARGLAAPEVVLVIASDQHSAHARMAQFVALVDRVRKENAGAAVAVLINGDAFEGGNAVARRSEGAVEFAMFHALAQRGPTVLNLGNHEADFFDMASAVRRIQANGVTVISNLLDRATGKPFTSATARLRLGARDVVIAGLTTDLLATYRAAIRPTLDATNPATWAEKNFPTIFAGAAVPVVMAHTGLEADREILRHAPAGALYIGGHDHAQFVARLKSVTYVQSGAWGSHVSIARLEHGAWHVEQVAFTDGSPADPNLAALAAQMEKAHATPEDLAKVGRTAVEMSSQEAAQFVVEAVRKTAGAQAAAIGATTFGAGVPQGDVTERVLDAWVRFDGEIWVGEISGADLLKLAHRSNQSPETPWEMRSGENLILVAPEHIDPARIYRIATNDWAVKNARRYFGEHAPVFAPRAELRLKAVVAQALQP